jgi:hypothetical protein
MLAFSLARPAETLFVPAASPPLTERLGSLARARLMRDAPMAMLPDALFRETRLTVPSLGRAPALLPRRAGRMTAILSARSAKGLGPASAPNLS